MSRIYFHSPSGTAELRGSERAWLRSLVDDLAMGVLSPDDLNADRLMGLVLRGHWLHDIERVSAGWLFKWQWMFRLAWRSGDSGFLAWRGRQIDPWTLTLNTALRIGNDPVKLAARLHGQCELHAWVDGPNRAWLADVIEQGLEAGIYRRTLLHAATSTGPVQEVSQGWDEVVTLLRSRDDEPVVTSYSVCEGFPDPDNSTFEPERPDGWKPSFWNEEHWATLTDAERTQQWESDGPYELFNALPIQEQWRHAMEWLRARPGNLEIEPEGFGDYWFGHGLSALDLKRGDWERRFEEAFADDEPAPVA